MLHADKGAQHAEHPGRHAQIEADAVGVAGAGAGAGAEDQLVLGQIGHEFVEQRKDRGAAAIDEALAADLDDVGGREDGQGGLGVGLGEQGLVASGKAPRGRPPAASGVGLARCLPLQPPHGPQSLAGQRDRSRSATGMSPADRDPRTHAAPMCATRRPIAARDCWSRSTAPQPGHAASAAATGSARNSDEPIKSIRVHSHTLQTMYRRAYAPNCGTLHGATMGRATSGAAAGCCGSAYRVAAEGLEVDRAAAANRFPDLLPQ